ncbi:hypothetical protein AAFF_G00436410 [Aldrovandia affinis]|uniref:Uncharacterized protein n=1 Tax=Aldrovandia affinis TaxID=143900 RepID=A0AAD7S8G4_9TELE|nr:hypothetical protein AAFF_G00436410 [Aldrovandia affinis]
MPRDNGILNFLVLRRGQAAFSGMALVQPDGPVTLRPPSHLHMAKPAGVAGEGGLVSSNQATASGDPRCV